MKVTPPPDLRALAREARKGRRHAHAAYSHYKVGAALLAADGTVFTGCNIENATYGLTVCAERVALWKALSEGVRRFTAVAVVVGAPPLASPCGACRQLLWEFGGDLWVQLETIQGSRRRTLRLSELFPFPFDARNL